MITIRRNGVTLTFCFHKDEISLRPEYFLSFSNDAHVIFDTKILLLDNPRTHIKMNLLAQSLSRNFNFLDFDFENLAICKII